MSEKSLDALFDLLNGVGEAIYGNKSVERVWSDWKKNADISTSAVHPFQKYFVHDNTAARMRGTLHEIMKMVINGTADKRVTRNKVKALLEYTKDMELPKGGMEDSDLLEALAVIITDANDKYKNTKTVTRMSILASLVAAALNPNLIGWEVSPAATTLERQLINIMVEEFVYYRANKRTDIFHPLIKDNPGGVVNDNTFNDLVTAFLVAKNKFFAEYPLYYGILNGATLDEQSKKTIKDMKLENYFKEQRSKGGAATLKKIIVQQIKKMEKTEFDQFMRVNVADVGNLRALNEIRETILEDRNSDIVVIASETMASMARDLMHFTGFDKNNVHVIPGARVTADTLKAAIKEERRKNNIVLMICLAKDEIDEGALAAAQKYIDKNILYSPWFHVLVNNESLKRNTAERKILGQYFDSVSIDLQKVFRMPHGTSMVLFKNEQFLQNYLKQSAPYLDFDVPNDSEYGTNIGRYSVLGSKGFNSLPLLFTLFVHGRKYTESSKSETNPTPLIAA